MKNNTKSFHPVFVNFSSNKKWNYFRDFKCLWTLNPIIAGAAIYIPKFKAITEIPNPKTSDSEPSSANVIIEREHPMFQEAVRAFITPMISTLSIMTLAEDGSEAEVLGLGISVIALNLGMYIAAPAVIGFKVHKHLKSRK